MKQICSFNEVMGDFDLRVLTGQSVFEKKGHQITVTNLSVPDQKHFVFPENMDPDQVKETIAGVLCLRFESDDTIRKMFQSNEFIIRLNHDGLPEIQIKNPDVPHLLYLFELKIKLQKTDNISPKVKLFQTPEISLVRKEIKPLGAPGMLLVELERFNFMDEVFSFQVHNGVKRIDRFKLAKIYKTIPGQVTLLMMDQEFLQWVTIPFQVSQDGYVINIFKSHKDAENSVHL